MVGSALETVEVNQPDAVGSRLAELGVTQEILIDAVRQGQLAAAFTTKAHPVWYAGSRANAETVGALRTALGSRGWVVNDDDNIARIISPDSRVVITALSGDERTGLQGGSKAQPRHKRGEAGMRLVMVNSQLAMNELLPPDRRDDADALVADHGPTWFLLYYRDGDTIRCELSLARRVSDDGNALEWAERLILPSFDLVEPTSGTTTELTTDVIEIEVPLERRASAS